MRKFRIKVAAFTKDFNYIMIYFILGFFFSSSFIIILFKLAAECSKERKKRSIE